jgi:hypothetical protein
VNSVCGDRGISIFAFIVNQYIQRTVNSVFAPPVNSVFAKVRLIVFLAKEISRSPVSPGG